MTSRAMCHAVMSQLSDYAELWVISAVATLMVVCSKLGHKLFGISINPPEDPAAFTHWRRRRRWLLISELSAVPTFATVAVLATIHFKLSTAQCVGLSMGLGGLGFGFMLNGLKYVVQGKLERATKGVSDV